MRKKVFHLRPGVPVYFFDKKGNRVAIKLGSVDVTEMAAQWELEVRENDREWRLIEGHHGEEEPLCELWPESWVAMCSPLKLYPGASGYAPEFVVKVPDEVSMTLHGGRR